MNYKEGFDRLSLALAVLAALVAFWLILEDTNWVAPTKSEGLIYAGMSLLAALGVWVFTRFIGWVVAGFTQQRRGPPA